MADYSQDACVTLSFGLSGYGKTSFCFRYLLNAATVQAANPNPAACIFIVDWKMEASDRLGIPLCNTAAQCEAAIGSRWVVFNPHLMFPGDRETLSPEGKPVLNDEKMALRWFAKWVFEVSKRGPGRKILYVDELRNFGNKHAVMPEINRVIRMGRSEHLEFLSSTQYPRDYHADIRAGVTEWVCFNTVEPDDLDKVRPYFKNVDEVADLKKGHFIAYNRDSRSILRSRIF